MSLLPARLAVADTLPLELGAKCEPPRVARPDDMAQVNSNVLRAPDGKLRTVDFAPKDTTPTERVADIDPSERLHQEFLRELKKAITSASEEKPKVCGTPQDDCAPFAVGDWIVLDYDRECNADLRGSDARKSIMWRTLRQVTGIHRSPSTNRWLVSWGDLPPQHRGWLARRFRMATPEEVRIAGAKGIYAGARDAVLQSELVGKKAHAIVMDDYAALEQRTLGAAQSVLTPERMQELIQERARVQSAANSIPKSIPKGFRPVELPYHIPTPSELKG